MRSALFPSSPLRTPPRRSPWQGPWPTAGCPVAYRLRLEEEGLHVRQGEREERFTWEGMEEAWRLKRCLCVYVEGRRAYLLPPRDEEEGERLWAFLTARLPGKTWG